MDIWGLHPWASLKGIVTCIWPFGCGFAYAIIMGCAGFKLSFGLFIVSKLLIIIKERLGIKGPSSGLGSVLNHYLGIRCKLSWVTILDCWDSVSFIITACCPAYLFVWAGELYCIIEEHCYLFLLYARWVRLLLLYQLWVRLTCYVWSMASSNKLTS